MNGKTAHGRGAQGRSRFRQAGVLAAVVTGTAVLAAACAGSGSPSGAGKAAGYRKSLAFAQCMRSHGEPGWPDPTDSGTFTDNQIDINSPQYAAALSACGNLLPGDVAPLQLSAAQKQQRLDMALKNAECMRAHGVSNFPDPGPRDVQPDGNISLGSFPHSEVNTPQFRSAVKACEALTSKEGGGS
jgi:hypothetical protein